MNRIKHLNESTEKNISSYSLDSFPNVFNQNNIPHITDIISPSTQQWPQQGYNQQHIGRCPYSTSNNPGTEKWRFPSGECDGSPTIAGDGTIYYGGWRRLYAINPNGTLKWQFKSESALGDFGSSPAIAPDGTIYIGTKYGSYIQAVNPNGTEKWSIGTPEIDTSITLDENGVLYYGHHAGVDARYPNGTLKWRFYTDDIVQSTPAIDTQGIIYFGSHDHYIYAVYPNGTLNWRYQTGGWVHGSPAIGIDGTIYCGSDDRYFYAIYLNGTTKWRTETGSQRASPSQDKEGNLYFGVWENKIYSISPNGTIRWEFTIGNRGGVWGSTAAISDDGTMYIGSCIEIGSLGGGEIIVLDLNGTLKWRKTICDSVLCSSPVIAADGTVYICASNDGSPEAWGYLHAFGRIENNQPPETPILEGPTEGKVRSDLRFVTQAEDFDNTPVSYYFDWGDGTHTQTVDYEPGIPVPCYHQYNLQKTYTVKVKAIDSCGLESDWATLQVSVPKNNAINNFFLSRLLQL